LARLFGTDGVRGVANLELTAELAMGLGRAGAWALARHAGRAPRLLLGRDPRRSGDMLAAALAAGATSVGAEVVAVGVVTTPGVAFLVRALGLDAGAMVSASHNPPEYNGIKFFDRSGYKLPDAVEDEIEAAVRRPAGLPRPSGAALGRVLDRPEVRARYVDFLAGCVPSGALSGLRVVADCANGAAWELGPEALRRAGAEVETIAAAPDGLNINVGCGSLHPEALAAEVVRRGFDAGFAFDGDADRLIAVDERGRRVDGDAVLAIAGRRLLARDELPGRTVVGTVMSNLGLELCLAEAGGRLVRAKVGDRYVLEAMLAGGYQLGGEPSGHVVFGASHTTGDGILTALKLGAILRETARPLSELAAEMPRFPQVLVNVPVAADGPVADRLEASPSVRDAVRGAEAELGRRGRVVIRPSGTEPLVRIMLEGEDEARVRRLAGELATVVAGELGAGAPPAPLEEMP
jgi:phosphoglucosamine mutase